MRGFNGYQRDGDTFYSYTSFVTPNTIYHYDVAGGKSTVFKQAKVDVDPSLFERVVASVDPRNLRREIMQRARGSDTGEGTAAHPPVEIGRASEAATERLGAAR